MVFLLRDSATQELGISLIGLGYFKLTIYFPGKKIIYWSTYLPIRHFYPFNHHACQLCSILLHRFYFLSRNYFQSQGTQPKANPFGEGPPVMEIQPVVADILFNKAT